MRRALLIFACLALLASGAQAGSSALDLLRYGPINILDDEDYEGFADANYNAIDLTPADPLLPPVIHIPGQGEFLISMWNVQTVFYDGTTDAKDASTHAFTALAVAKVKNAGQGPIWIQDLVPASPADWAGLITAGLLPAGVTPQNAGSFGILYSDAVKDNPPDRWINPDIDGDSTPLPVTDKPTHRPEDWAADFATAVGTPLWEFGFTGGFDAASGAPIAGPGESWTAVIAPLLGIVDFNAHLNQTHAYAPVLGIELLPHNFLAKPGGNLFQFQLNGQVTSPRMVGDGLLRTDTDIYIKPIPEPGSLALLGLGLLGVGAVVRRRRK